MLILMFLLTFFPDVSKSFRVSAVQESQVWIEGGLLDGLQEEMEGEIYYEISIAGQKRRIVPAKVRLSKVEDRQSIGALHEQSGIVNLGYAASFVPKPASDLLTLFNMRALDAYAAKDFALSKAYYQRILEALPGDPFATEKIKDCDAQLEKLAALARERRNVPYYRQVIQTSLESNNPEGARLAQTYVDKILAVLPGDPDAQNFRGRIEKLLSKPEPDKKASVAAAESPVTKPEAEKKTSVATAEPTAMKPEPEKKATAAVSEPAATKPAPEKKVVVTTAEPPTPEPRSPIPTLAPPPRLKDMILIPEGTYSIGTNPNRSPFANETPKHEVHLASFYIDKYEVTNEDYKRFCDAAGRIYPGYFKDGKIPPGLERKPVVMVSWIDADVYARWAGKRLPAEIEWEAAAAGPSGRIWLWGDVWEPNLAATRESGETEASDVGSHPGDVSQYGVYDMAGNVSEWTADWYKPYPGNARREKEYGEQFRVLRGGSVKASKEFARAQFRARLPDGFRSSDLGFRCALSKQ